MFRNGLSARTFFALGRYVNCRAFSNASIYRVFPATLYRFQTLRKSKLYDKALEHEGLEYEDGVEVSSDGKVHTKITPDVSNGALFMPNTHFMQELTRCSFDDYMAAVGNGQTPGEPHIVCIPKGTHIPTPLVLFHEQTSRFTLQPQQAMPLAELNDILTRFYSDSGHVNEAGKWLDKNPYHEAELDDSEEWMVK